MTAAAVTAWIDGKERSRPTGCVSGGSRELQWWYRCHYVSKGSDKPSLLLISSDCTTVMSRCSGDCFAAKKEGGARLQLGAQKG